MLHQLLFYLFCVKNYICHRMCGFELHKYSDTIYLATKCYLNNFMNRIIEEMMIVFTIFMWVLSMWCKLRRANLEFWTVLHMRGKKCFINWTLSCPIKYHVLNMNNTVQYSLTKHNYSQLYPKLRWKILILEFEVEGDCKMECIDICSKAFLFIHMNI